MMDIVSPVPASAPAPGSASPATAKAARDFPAAKAARDFPAAKAARDFEAVFIGQMTKTMMETADAQGPFSGGHGEEMFRGVLAEKLGGAIAARGGIGLAPAVMKQIIALQESIGQESIGQESIGQESIGQESTGQKGIEQGAAADAR